MEQVIFIIVMVNFTFAGKYYVIYATQVCSAKVKAI